MSAATARVGVNLLWLVPGEVGGSEEYTVRLLRALAQLDPPGLDVTLFANRSLVEAHPGLTTALPTVVAPLSGRSRPLRVAAESTWLAAEARRRRLHVVHHAGGTMPEVLTTPGIVTLHDLQPLSHPERFSILKRTYIKTVAPRSLRRARLVVTLTRFTGDDAVARCGVDPSRVRLVPAGIDDPGSGPSAAERVEVLRRLRLEGRRAVLYPAITYAHKNHETLVRAVARLVEERPDVVLVLTGGAGPCEDQVMAAVEAYGLSEHVRRPGRVPELDLEVLYRTAAVVAFPSAYEGFGLPVLEAMSRGCPVVAADAAALPAVTGGAADLVAPYDVEGWTTALARLLDDPDAAAERRRSGRRRAARFPWGDAAAALAEVYREAALGDRTDPSPTRRETPPDRPPSQEPR